MRAAFGGTVLPSMMLAIIVSFVALVLERTWVTSASKVVCKYWGQAERKEGKRSERFWQGFGAPFGLFGAPFGHKRGTNGASTEH